MKTFSPANKRTLFASLSLILLTNAIVFAGVAYNRSGEPESQITLTERELRLPYYNVINENTGIALQVFYRVKTDKMQEGPYYMYSNNIDWLDKDKLASLGVDVSRPLQSEADKYYYRRHSEKEVVLVLEYDGSAYQAALKKAKENLQQRQVDYDKNPKDREAENKLKFAKDNLQREKQSASRLFVIDVGLDPEALRQQYPDRHNTILLKGVIGVQITGTSSSPDLIGYVKSLSNAHIHVPLSGHNVLEPIMEDGTRNWQKDPPRYAVKLNIGKRLEPWVESVERIVN